MSALVSIYIGGFLTLVIALYHTQLYKKLNWAEAFEKIDSENAKIIYTINLALTILFFMIGFLSVFYARELSESNGFALGFCLVYSGFWIWRLVWQILWLNKGKDRPETGKILIPLVIAFCYLIPVISIFL